MNDTERTGPTLRWMAPIAALLLAAGATGCGVINDFSSEVNCREYCAKDFDCDQHDPTSDETDACVDECRDSIEDTCGNDNQADANDQIGDCVDLSCTEFRACMVFEAAPACFGFAD